MWAFAVSLVTTIWMPSSVPAVGAASVSARTPAFVMTYVWGVCGGIGPEPMS